jgi:hypothetical protein
MMGAWGTDTFADDGAMDWVGEFLDAEEGMPSDDDEEPSTKEGLIITALSNLSEAGASEYVEADDATKALAAAEVLAAWIGKPSATLREAGRGTKSTAGNTLGQLMGWIATTRSPLKNSKELRSAASKAVSRVLKSELAELWEESDSGAEWRQGVKDLEIRLR